MRKVVRPKKRVMHKHPSVILSEQLIESKLEHKGLKTELAELRASLASSFYKASVSIIP
jgi:hypothetical protein